MKIQISRDSHDPSKRYSGVYQQQGRMITDADWNELVSILKGRLEDALSDLVGAGSPNLRALQIQNDLRIVPGRLYVDGLQAVFPGQSNSPVAYGAQPDFPQAPGAPQHNEWLYADVWERPVLAIQDPNLRDRGLHGADTCARTQTIVQIKRSANASDITNTAFNPPRGDSRLTLSLRTAASGSDPNDPCAAAVDVDRPLGNFLFRVEVHDVQGSLFNPTQITLKWSSENGAEAHENGAEPDDFKGNDYTYEFFDDTSERHLGVHLVSASGFPRRPALVAGYPSVPPDRAQQPYVRRWDGHCVLTRVGTTWTLSSGSDRGAPLSAALAAGAHGRVAVTSTHFQITLQSLDLSLQYFLNPGYPTFVAGDHWLAAVREADTAGTTVLSAATPAGIVHHYARLGQVSIVGAATSFTADRPTGFPALSELPSQSASSPGAARIGSGALSPSSGFTLSAGNVWSQIGQLLGYVNQLRNPGNNATDGASLIGSGSASASALSLTAGTVASQIGQLLAHINGHITNASAAHGSGTISSGAVAAPTGGFGLTSSSVSNQLIQLLGYINQFRNPTNTSADGGALIGSAAITSGSNPRTLNAGTLRAQIAQLLGVVNDEVAPLAHTHDDRYMQRVYFTSNSFTSGQTRSEITTAVTETNAGRIVAHVTGSIGGTPNTVFYLRGPTVANNISVTIDTLTATSGRVVVTNNHSATVYIGVTLFLIPA